LQADCGPSTESARSLTESLGRLIRARELRTGGPGVTRGTGAAFLKKRRFRTPAGKIFESSASFAVSSQNAGMGGSRACANLEPLGTAVAQREADLVEALACQEPGLIVSTKGSPRGELAHSPTIGPPIDISDAHQIVL
jgi:hypothetical protein